MDGLWNRSLEASVAPPSSRDSGLGMERKKGLIGEWEKLSEAQAWMDGEAGQTQSPFTGRRAINNRIGHAFRGTLSGTLVGWRKHV